jgi:hypothetical protein
MRSGQWRNWNSSHDRNKHQRSVPHLPIQQFPLLLFLSLGHLRPPRVELAAKKQKPPEIQAAKLQSLYCGSSSAASSVFSRSWAPCVSSPVAGHLRAALDVSAIIQRRICGPGRDIAQKSASRLRMSKAIMAHRWLSPPARSLDPTKSCRQLAQAVWARFIEAATPA